MQLSHLGLCSGCENLQDHTKAINDANPAHPISVLPAATKVRHGRRVRLSRADFPVFVGALYVVSSDSLLSIHDYIVPSLLQFLDLYSSQIRIDVNHVDMLLLLEEQTKLAHLALREVVCRADLASAHQATLGDGLAQVRIRPLIVTVHVRIVVEVKDEAATVVHALDVGTINVVAVNYPLLLVHFANVFLAEKLAVCVQLLFELHFAQFLAAPPAFDETVVVLFV